MRYEDNPALIDRLAAEYVLGTLHGQARKRFERLLAESASTTAAVNRWQTRLSDLVYAVDEQTPPVKVWQAIEARIDPVVESPGRLNFWRAWSALATAALIVSLTLLFTMPAETPLQQQIAVVNDESEAPLWLVSVNMQTGELKTTAVSATAENLDEVYELWMLPAEGDPQSLGLMPVNQSSTVRSFSPALLDLLRNAKGLAVSIEPKGGSPTGLPTGPIVYQAPLIEL